MAVPPSMPGTDGGEYFALFVRHPQPSVLFRVGDLAIVAANDAAIEMYGYSREEFLSMTILDLASGGDTELLRHSFARDDRSVHHGRTRGQHRYKNGAVVDVDLTWTRVGGDPPVGLLAVGDCTRSSRSARLLLSSNHLLDRIAHGDPLQRTLDTLVEFAETELPELLGSVVLLDDAGAHIHVVSAPNLPEEYSRSIDGAPIGPMAGSCGTAAWFGKPVIVSDIRTDERWAGYRDVALKYGLAACWSTPILAASGKVLGTFALYYRDPRRPHPEEVHLIELVTAVARTAIEADRAREALALGHRALRGVLDGSPCAIAVIDGDGLVQSWNPSAERTLGWTADEVIGRLAVDSPLLITPDLQGEIDQARDGVTTQRLGVRRARKDGLEIWLDRWVAPVAGASTHRPAVMVMFVDATERVTSTAAVHRSMQVRTAILDALPAPIALVGDDGNVIATNRAWVSSERRQWFAGSGCPLGGGYIDACRADPALGPEHGIACANAVASVLDGRSDGVVLQYPAGPADDRHWYDFIAAPVPARHPSAAVVVHIDITERKRLAEHLARAQKFEAVGRLAAGIAHDFNNLLTVITGCLHLLENDLVDGRGAPLLAEMHEAAQRAGELTRHLLTFGSQQELRPGHVDLGAAVRRAEPLIRRAAGDRVSVVLDVGAEVAPVFVDHVQLERVLLNLVVNARDAMPAGGALTISVDTVGAAPGAPRPPGLPPGAYVTLHVADTGHGMGDEVRARLFEPFFTTKGSAGTGIGLPIVYGIVQQSGGVITVDTAPGAGARFSIYLPRHDPAAQAGR